MNNSFQNAEEFKRYLIEELKYRGYYPISLAVIQGHWCANIIGYGWRRVSDCMQDAMSQSGLGSAFCEVHR
jgi:hypothetical protein